MPKMVMLVPKKGYKPTPSEREGYEAAMKRGPVRMAFQKAIENVRNAEGMYEIAPETPPSAPATRTLEDMGRQELLVMALSLGMKTDKQMKVSEIRSYVEQKLAEVELVSDDPNTTDA